MSEHHPVRPPKDPPPEPPGAPRLIVNGGFIGQSEAGGFCGPGKYIVIGQAPPIGRHGSRYGVTIRNGRHFCSLRVVPSQGDSILSWGDRLMRFRYEGNWWAKRDYGRYRYPRDIMTIDRCGHVVVFGGITSNCYYYRSDLRLKEEIEPIDGALGKVLAMQGVSFRFKGTNFGAKVEAVDDDPLPAGPLEGAGARSRVREQDEEDEDPEATRRRLGLIAQEVEKVCPEVVSTDEKGFKSMDMTQINAILVEAIKDQQKIIDAQQARLERMEKALAKLGIEI